MGRLPSSFGGRTITARSPWTMAGELELSTAQPGIQFPDATFLNNTDRPFEIHRMIPFVIAEDAQKLALGTQPVEDLLASLVRIKITDLGKNNPLTKSPTLLRLLVKGSSEFTWEWADPYYLAKSEQFQVICDALAFPASLTDTMSFIKIGINFEGFFVSVGPASDVR